MPHWFMTREALRKETSGLGSAYVSWVRKLHDSVKLLHLDDEVLCQLVRLIQMHSYIVSSSQYERHIMTDI